MREAIRHYSAAIGGYCPDHKRPYEVAEGHADVEVQSFGGSPGVEPWIMLSLLECYRLDGSSRVQSRTISVVLRGADRERLLTMLRDDVERLA